MVSVPHSASPRFEVPFNEEPEHAILLSGVADAYWYPDRAAVMQRIDAGDTRFVQLRHPGYDSLAQAVTGCAYADEVRRHLAAITDGSRLTYIVGKVSIAAAWPQRIRQYPPNAFGCATLACGFRPAQHCAVCRCVCFLPSPLHARRSLRFRRREPC